MAKRIRMGLKKNTKAHRFVQNLPLASGRCSQLHLPDGRMGTNLVHAIWKQVFRLTAHPGKISTEF